MTACQSASKFGRALRRFAGAGLGIVLVCALAAPVHADRRPRHWNGDRVHTRVFFDLGLFLPLYPYYYYPPYYYPPRYYEPYYYPPPVVVQPPRHCETGLWRFANGNVVQGTACQRPDGTWELLH